MPFDIYTPALKEPTAPVVPTFTKLTPNGLRSPSYGLLPDHGVGFVISSADKINPQISMYMLIMLPSI